MSKEKLYLYPTWLRVWHGLNAISILSLVITGISLQYSTAAYVVDFESAISFHNIFGIMLAVLYIPFIVGNIITINGESYKMKIKGLMNRLFIQGRYYLIGYFKNENPPFPISKKEKFNPLQKVAYVFTMYLFLPAVIISGLGLLFPEFIIEDVLGFRGIQLTAIFHSMMGFFLSLFLIIHVYIVSVGKNPFSNFKSMINGYH